MKAVTLIVFLIMALVMAMLHADPIEAKKLNMLKKTTLSSTTSTMALKNRSNKKKSNEKGTTNALEANKTHKKTHLLRNYEEENEDAETLGKKVVVKPAAATVLNPTPMPMFLTHVVQGGKRSSKSNKKKQLGVVAALPAQRLPVMLTRPLSVDEEEDEEAAILEEEDDDEEDEEDEY